MRWSGIWQRPQQIHSRLARNRRITFIEEPLPCDGHPTLDYGEPTPGVRVVQPRLPERLLRDRVATEATVGRLLRHAAETRLASRTRSAVHWLYTPMMRRQVASFRRPAALVYDCMDELSQFDGAPDGLVRREEMLLAEADLVLCGGPALYEAKRRRHRNAHLFGCGVDYDHFHRALDESANVHPDVDRLPRPRIGYVGAIDERLDYELLDRLARLHPEWSLVLVGPVVKVDPGVLPQRSNVHALGARPYAELPSLIAGFDACLMPFALNAATEFINPTKTLEYLATGRPVVSTPIRDVKLGFADVVTIADAADVPAALEGLVASSEHDPAPGLARARASTWDATVKQMGALVRAAVVARQDARREMARFRPIGGASAAARLA